ncbi:uncharacterized protein LOC129616439 [Condylostylus longicornis]|uniref:uncharacterized protein LOC129616439 n=1 Tax=Condylostylus longicornis TaxID=2530218 RepID=UPI00244DD929|nr:uncharacterized protein LOC129616439 [Condylostylus longicornis]
MIQKLWLSRSGWDNDLEKALQDEWQNYRSSLTELEKIKITRWFSYTSTACKMELHGFCDASIKAYAAVVHLVVTNKSGSRQISLVAAKSKVAPIKTISLPRLELSGAALLAKLTRPMICVLKIMNWSEVRAWTDSQIVLAWLQGHPSKWTTVVANRTAEIHHLLGKNIWRHVPSKQNPADCASRGVLPLELPNLDLWWRGPEWLSIPEQFWPNRATCESTDEEVRKSATCNSTLTNDHLDNNILGLQNRLSTFTKLIRVTSYVRRFMSVIKKVKHGGSFITATEFNASVFTWIRIVQGHHFAHEIFQLQKRKVINGNSSLSKLGNFLDENGILRMTGRLYHSELNYNERFPIILPDKSPFVRLLLEKVHRETLHGGAQLMLNVLNRNYWIIGARNQIRQVIHKCITCYKERAAVQTQ